MSYPFIWLWGKHNFKGGEGINFSNFIIVTKNSAELLTYIDFEFIKQSI